MTPQMKLNDAYCIAPWVNVHINQQSNVKPCCAWTTDYDSVESYFNNPTTLIKLKTQLAANEPSEFCKKCGEKDWYNEFRNSELNNINDFQIESVDVRWASTCQLNCVYCDERWSSSWANLVNKNKVIPIKNERIKDTDLVFEFFSKYNIKRVSMLGGEPLLLKENAKLLDTIPDSTAIEIFTNLNIDLASNEVYQRLAKRSNVNWYVSMENIGAKFEFVRRGADWQQQVKNLNYLVDTNPKSVSLQSQYCAYSAFDLVDLYNFAQDHNVFVNMVHSNKFNPKVLDVFCYPREFKLIALEQIDQCLEKFSRSHHGLEPIKAKLLDNMDRTVPTIIQDCVEWHQSRETKFFNNRFDFVDLWPQFGKTSL